MSRHTPFKNVLVPALVIPLLVLAAYAKTAVGSGLSPLLKHVPSSQISNAVHLGRLDSDTVVPLVVALNLKDPRGLDAMIHRIYDPSDALYHHFLTQAQFTEAYAPSQADVDRVIQYLSQRGLTVKRVHPNRLFVDVEARASSVESAFQLELHQYMTAAGRIAYAPTSNPLVSDEVAAQLSGVVGLDNFAVRRTQLQRFSKQSAVSPFSNPPGHGMTVGGLTPSDIVTAYNIPTAIPSAGPSPVPGQGQTIGVVEYDGYTPSDVTHYASVYGLPAPSVSPVLTTGVNSNTAGSDADEVTLDIELVLALAPNATIKVYEGLNSDTGTLALMSKIATDGTAFLSDSWGLPEDESTGSTLASENTYLTQMVSQGQTFFAATGDNGAYGAAQYSINSLQVMDPSSQYYAVAVGGTTLSVNAATIAYVSESSWSDTTYTPDAGGGGGVSTLTSIPPWQAGLATALNHGSTTKRMVPDVSLDANPNSGYSIYFAGAWNVFGGTSASTPVWTAYSALINETRLAAGRASLGFLTPIIYHTAASSIYSATFHDIADGSSNLFYHAEPGFDLSTGLGSFKGTALFNALTAAVLPPAAPSALTYTQVSTTSVTMNWPAVGGVTSYDLWVGTSVSGPFTDLCVAVMTTTCTLTGLTEGTTYYSYVTATNAAATSGPSTIVSGSPLLMAPSTPTGLTAAASN